MDTRRDDIRANAEQDLLPAGVADAVFVVAGPVTGGALLAHTIVGLLDGMVRAEGAVH